MPSPDSLLDRIPNELLGMIKKYYDDDDLVGHVNFFQLTARTAAFYPNPGPLWEKLCRVNGLGRLPGREVKTQTIDWFYIARECAVHAVECKHPGCGTARMAENAKKIRQYTKRWPYTYTLTKVDKTADGVSSTIFEHIGFRKVKPTPMWETADYVAYLRGADGEIPPDSVMEHPIARRSFATFPPVDNISFISPPSMFCEDVQSQYGITVEHILQSMYPELRHPLTVSHAAELLDQVSADVFPQEWSSQDRFDSLREMKDWFDIVKWKGLQYEEFEQGRRSYLFTYVACPAKLSAEAILSNLTVEEIMAML